MDLHEPALVLHFRQRADSFYAAARDLSVLNEMPGDAYGAAIGLLSVHGCIALADAVLVAAEGSKSEGDDHREATRRLRRWCSASGVEDRGIKHLEWLLGRKGHFAYDDRPVRSDEIAQAKVKMDQFFAWAFQTFPGVAQLRGEAQHA